MKIRTTIVVALLCALTVIYVAAQEKKQEPQFKLIEFQMSLLKRGPKWSSHSDKATLAVESNHLAYAQSLMQENKAAVFGSIKDDSDLLGVYIFRTKSAEEANQWAMADPLVRDGRAVVETHLWWSEDVMKKGGPSQKTSTVYFAFLTRGDKWTPERTPATEAIQKGHMENIQRLADLKKLVVAGPFGDDGKLRGIFIFRVNSIEEARELAATDPAVKAGRLALDIHPYVVPDGILP